MELYIEEEFLENFFIETDEDQLSAEEEKFITMLSEYGDKTVFMNYEINNIEELEALKTNNKYFALLCAKDKAPIEIDDIKKQLFKSDFSQTLVFTNEEKDWFDEAEKKGALCFSFDNYKEKIRSLNKKVVFKLSLNEGFPGWKILNGLREIPSTKIIIKDHYILSNKDNQKIAENFIPLLNTILPEQCDRILVETFTKEFPDQKKFEDKPLKIKEKVKELYTVIKKSLKLNNVHHKIYSLEYETNYKYHDRYIISNFYFIACTDGFNRMPSRETDSIMEGYSIFDKFYYKHMQDLKKRLTDYKAKLDSVERGFKYFPEHF